MKILWANYCDYSNLTYGFSRALQSVGIDSEAVCLIPHAYGYAEQATHVSTEQMMRKMDEADCIVIGHTQPAILNLAVNRGKRLFVIHTGTLFRGDPDKYNAMFNPIVERTFIDSPEFYNLGCKNVSYVAAAIDVHKYIFTRQQNDPRVFAHYPSNGGFKGTERIKQMMAMTRANFICDDSIVSHEENLKRIAACDVYIEMFSPLQDGKNYGSFGVTAFEAAAMGKIVITNSTNHSVYLNTYRMPDCLCRCNSEPEFIEAVVMLAAADQEMIAVAQQGTRQWMELMHSYVATGDHLKRFFI